MVLQCGMQVVNSIGTRWCCWMHSSLGMTFTLLNVLLKLLGIYTLHFFFFFFNTNKSYHWNSSTIAKFPSFVPRSSRRYTINFTFHSLAPTALKFGSVDSNYLATVGSQSSRALIKWFPLPHTFAWWLWLVTCSITAPHCGICSCLNSVLSNNRCACTYVTGIFAHINIALATNHKPWCALTGSRNGFHQSCINFSVANWQITSHLLWFRHCQHNRNAKSDSTE